jgi:hypothetical protein
MSRSRFRAALTDNTLTTMFAASPGNYIDLVMLVLSNSSATPVSAAIIEDATTVMNVVVPANGNFGFTTPPKIQGSGQGLAWKIQLSGTANVDVFAQAETTPAARN